MNEMNYSSPQNQMLMRRSLTFVLHIAHLPHRITTNNVFISLCMSLSITDCLQFNYLRARNILYSLAVDEISNHSLGCLADHYKLKLKFTFSHFSLTHNIFFFFYNLRFTKIRLTIYYIYF
jgi:hypothetical protein